MKTIGQWTWGLSIEAKREAEDDPEEMAPSKRSRSLGDEPRDATVDLIEIRRDMLFTERLKAIEENLVRLGAYTAPFDSYLYDGNSLVAPVEPNFDFVDQAQRQEARDLYKQWVALMTGASKAFELLSERQERGYDAAAIVRLLARGIHRVQRKDVYKGFSEEQMKNVDRLRIMPAMDAVETPTEQLRRTFFMLKPPNSDFSSRPHIQDTLERLVAYFELPSNFAKKITSQTFYNRQSDKAENSAEKIFFTNVVSYVQDTQRFIEGLDYYSSVSNTLYSHFGGLYYIGAYEMPIEPFLRDVDKLAMHSYSGEKFIAQRMLKAIESNELTSKQDIVHYVFPLLERGRNVALASDPELIPEIRSILDPQKTNPFWVIFEQVYPEYLTFIDTDGSVVQYVADFLQLFNPQNKTIAEFGYDENSRDTKRLADVVGFNYTLNEKVRFFVFGKPMSKSSTFNIDELIGTGFVEGLIDQFRFRPQMYTLSYKDRYNLLEQFRYFEMFRRMVAENTDQEAQLVYEMCSGLRLPYVYDETESRETTKRNLFWSKSLFSLAKNKPWRYTVVTHYFKTLLKQQNVSTILKFAETIARHRTEFDNMGIRFEQICLEMIRKRIFNEDPANGYSSWNNFIDVPEENQGTFSFLTFFWEEFGEEEGNDILQDFSDARSVFFNDPTVRNAEVVYIGSDLFTEMLDNAKHFSTRTLCNALCLSYRHETTVQGDVADLRALVGIEDRPRVELLFDQSFITGPEHADARYTQTRQAIIERVDSSIPDDVYQDINLTMKSDVSPEEASEMLSMLVETLSI